MTAREILAARNTYSFLRGLESSTCELTLILAAKVLKYLVFRNNNNDNDNNNNNNNNSIYLYTIKSYS